MNERIQELAELCTSSFVNMHAEWEEDFDKEKFAELIVRDVVEQIIIRERNDGEWYQHDIFKHFGVEE
jgi:hypothetical protein